jgi:hypothetical protein
MSRTSVLILCLAGCATAGHHAGTGEDPDARRDEPIDAPAGDIDAAPGHPDAAPGTPDAAPTPDAGSPDAMVQTGAASSLLLSEIELAPTGGEFIEIVNPTAAPVALDHYYLSDSGTYWKLPAGQQLIDSGDFIVKFPAGATIPQHGVITIAIDTAANFKTANLVDPTYSVAGGTMTAVDVNGIAGLTNTGELVALFYWDGQSDVVTDVDLMLAGKPASGNTMVAKSGIAIDGPDTGATTTTYKADVDALADQPTSPASGKTTKRLLLETGHETQNGTGNGSGGDDETSEATATTWDTTFTAPTPGSVPPALVP